jgi:hypothetical protein
MTDERVTEIRTRLAVTGVRLRVLVDPAQTRAAGLTDRQATDEIVALSQERRALLAEWDAIDAQAQTTRHLLPSEARLLMEDAADAAGICRCGDSGGCLGPIINGYCAPHTPITPREG